MPAREHIEDDSTPGGAAGRLPVVVRRFLATEAAGGAVLLLAAVVALVWANSPWQAGYRSWWSNGVTLGVGRFAVNDDLRHWVNDGLMALFFLVVGLEIRRELVHGQLRDRKAAALPAMAAAGGMAAPALLYLLVTAGSDGARGWGIPMATDIAFAVGVLALIGRRVPVSLKLFLLTLAIVDDLGAIAVIAIFYAGDVRPAWLLAGAGLLVLIVALSRAGLTGLLPFAILGFGVWLAVRASGVHPTVAGVLLGFAAPPRSAERLEERLHPWTSFLVVPLFALANAGVELRARALDGPGAGRVASGVALGLVVGKTLGITGAAWLAVRTGLGRLPDGVTWAMVAGVAALGGIGFTVALFIAELGLPEGELHDAGKLGVLAASTVAAVFGAGVLRWACRDRPEGDDEDRSGSNGGPG